MANSSQEDQSSVVGLQASQRDSAEPQLAQLRAEVAVERVRAEAAESTLRALQGDHGQALAELEALRGHLQEQEAAWVVARRQALLAEHAGQLVPELIQGATLEDLEASVQTAREAFQRITQSIQSQGGPKPPARAARPAGEMERFTALEKITNGLNEEAPLWLSR